MERPALILQKWVLALVCAAGVVAALLLPAVPQDPAYHHFADRRTFAGVPNLWNVLSNAGFIAVGLAGVRVHQRMRVTRGRREYLAFCVAIITVGLGSAWYHLAPSTTTLVWDRLPMSVAFMALFSIVLGDRVSWRLARSLSGPLMLIGAASVLYWYWTETRGAGDLRAYGVVQFLPILLMPLMLLLCPGSRGSARGLWLTFAGYVLAKLAELFDLRIYQATGFSGHSIKHILSAAAVACAIVALLRLDPRRGTRREMTLQEGTA